MAGNGVSDGQLANEGTFNGGFISRNSDSDTIAKVDLLNFGIDPTSGANIINLQKNVNAIASALGIPTNQVYNYLFTWASSVVGLSSQAVTDKIEALVLKFRDTTGNGGHAHTAADGDGAAISITDVLDINQLSAQWQPIDATAASGTNFDITSLMTGKVDGGGPSDAGVITNAPNNRAYILDPVTETFVEDPEGQRVYGRITFSAGTWTLAFFTNEAGVETAYNLPSQDIRVFFLEVFTLSSVPTIPSSPAMFGTLDVTADVVDASATLRGVVNTIAQSFAGLKTFIGGIVNQGILAGSIETDATSTGTDQTVTPPAKMILRVTDSGLDSIGGFTTSSTVQFFYLINDTGGDLVLKNEFASANTDIITGSNSDLTLSDGAAVLVMRNTSTSRWLCVGGGGGSPFVLQAVGSSPNANGATYNSTTGDFSLQPADGTNPGVLTAGAQTIGGAKTFSGNISAANLSGTNSGDVTLAAFGSTPDAKGASISGQAITLQPANNTNPGLISLLAQTMGAGDKTFADSLIAGARVRGATATDSSTTGATATIASPAALILRVTNAALTGISKFSGPTNGQAFILVNLTGAPLTIVNANAATDDIVTGTGANLTMLNQAAVILFYDTTSTRWRIAGGSGSGGGTQSVETISTSTSLTASPTATNRWINVDATGGNIVITLPAASADTIGTNYFFKRSDSVESNTVTIQRAGGDTIDEGNTQTLPFQFSRMGITGLTATAWGVK